MLQEDKKAREDGRERELKGINSRRHKEGGRFGGGEAGRVRRGGSLESGGKRGGGNT